MRREGGTTLTSLTRVSAIARRRFSLLLPFGYACRKKNGIFLFLLTGVRMCCFYLLPYFKRVKVGACQQVLQVEVAPWLRLFQHDHGVCLSEE